MDSPVAAPIGQVSRHAGLLGIILAATTALWAGEAHAAYVEPPPVPDSPDGVAALLRWCWTHKDATRYRDLFTADYQFIPQAPDLPWTRDDELRTVSALFGAGSGDESGVFEIALRYGSGDRAGTLHLPNEPYPEYQQLLTQADLHISRFPGTDLDGSGMTLFHLVRGDVAAIPAEMQARGFRPDPNRWYIQKWEDAPAPGLVVDHPFVDHPPSLSVTGAMSLGVGQAFTMNVSANDVDGDAITSLSASIPPGARFTHAPDNTTGQLTWTPTVADIGVHAVTFTAANRLSASATTILTVWANGAPRAALGVSPSAGIAPLLVRLDASGSADPDGAIQSYRFDFGDGSSGALQPNPIATHIYAKGTWTATVTVTDNAGAATSAQATVSVTGVNQAPVASLQYSPSTGQAPLLVAFDASSSRDPDGRIVRYDLDFGDGVSQTLTGTIASHTYNAEGRYTAVLTVTDNEGKFATAQALVIATGDLSAAPAPDSPANVVSLLRWCWTHKDATRYRDLFTADYQFVPEAPDLAWRRDDELNAASALFGTGRPGQAGAQSISLEFVGNPPPGTCFFPDKPYPLHQQDYSEIALHVTRQDGSSLNAGGTTLLYLVRGDIAAIPTEMQARGVRPDPNRWYIERWDDTPPSDLRVDHPPALVVPPSQRVQPGQPLAMDISASDPDDDELTSLTAALPPGAVFVSSPDHTTGHLTWTPTIADTGVYSVTFTASNRLSATATTVLTVGVNKLPRAALSVSPNAGAQPLLVRLDGSASVDPDGTLHRFRFDFGDGTSQTQGYPILTHTYQKGSWTATLTITDDDGAVDSAKVSLQVSGPNVAPVASWQYTPTSGPAPLVVTFNGGGSRDPDGRVVRYSFNFGDGSPAQSGADSVAAHRYNAGSFRAVLTVTDDGGLTGTIAGNVIVTQSGPLPPSDRAPIVSAPTLVSAKAGQSLQVTVTASDPDGNAITSLTASPLTNASFQVAADKQSATLQWTPHAADQGDHVVVFTASNALSGSAQTTIHVDPLNYAPFATLTAQPQAGVEPLVVDFSAAGSSDRDGRIIQYRFDFGDNASAVQTSAFVRHTFMAGTYHTVVTVTDDVGASSSAYVDIIVSASSIATAALEPVTRLAAAWNNRGLEDYRRLLTADFEFQFANDDSAGFPYPGHSWTREQELEAVGRLFAGGYGFEPPASSVDLRFLGNPIVGTSYVAGRSSPWHAQVLVPSLQMNIIRGWGTPDLHVEGQALFSVVRGDSAHLPQELIDQGVRPDSTRWFVEGWRDMSGPALVPNGAPVAAVAATPTSGVAPLTAWIDASRSHDDDGIIVGYRFDFGDGTLLNRSLPFAVHTFMPGAWTVRVTAIDDRGAESTSSLNVNVSPGETVPPVPQPNLAKNPSFESDTRYWNSYAGSQLLTVGEGHDGVKALQMTGPATLNGSFGVNDSPDIVRWTLGPGIHYRYTAWVRSPSSHGQAKLRVTEYLIAGGVKLGMATSNPVTLSPEWQQLTVDYTTTAANSTLDFQVRDFPLVPSEVFITDDISVQNVTSPGAGTGMAIGMEDVDGAGGLAFAPRLTPIPMRDGGTLRFVTSQSGALRVELLDLAGRRVRRVMDEADAPAGAYELPIGRVGADGIRLGAGVYFWRVAARDGVKSGRFVLLP